eukprot:876360-Pyramimonas_sp.AAC.1
MAQDIPRCLIMAPTMLPNAPRPLRDGSQWPKGSPSRPRRGQNLRKFYVFGCLAFSLPMAIRGLKIEGALGHTNK